MVESSAIRRNIHKLNIRNSSEFLENVEEMYSLHSMHVVLCLIF